MKPILRVFSHTSHATVGRQRLRAPNWTQTMRVSALIARMETQPSDRVALTSIAAGQERKVTYPNLMRASQAVSSMLFKSLGKKDLREGRVVALFPPGDAYVATALGVWRSGGIFVPLHYKNPVSELEYVVEDSDPSAIIAHSSMAQLLRPIAEQKGLSLIEVDKTANELAETVQAYEPASQFAGSRGALVIYTSGTTGKPKGVVSSHRTMRHQIADLVHAWEWNARDRIPHFLPLHHVHGVVNKLLCPLWEGATVEFQPKGGDARALWERLALSYRQSSGASLGSTPISLFMAVPTVYANMLEALTKIDSEDPELARDCRAGARALRVMISGSAPLPVSVLLSWERETGHRLLERYGMTEIGMCLSNPLYPVEQRYEGYVGRPLPSVRVRVVDAETEEEISPSSGKQGELRVKGHTVFSEYWRREDATAKEFDLEGWFKTGDIVIYDVEKESYRICGRSSVDIIKSAGYKISALDIERVLMEHSSIEECYVVGVPDEKYGERVAAIIRGSATADDLSPGALKEWCTHRLAPYKIPRVVKMVAEVPKNAMGKVNKKELKKVFS